MVQWTISSDERRELKRAAGELVAACADRNLPKPRGRVRLSGALKRAARLDTTSPSSAILRTGCRDEFFIGVRSVLSQAPFLLPEGREKMRAGFLGQNICSLGFGIATLQAPRLVMDEPVQEPLTPPHQPVQASLADEKDTPSTAPVANSPRLCV